MSYIEVLTGHGLTQEQWDNQIFEEYLPRTWWSFLMGTDPDSAIIYVTEDLTKKAGDAITIGEVGRISGGKVTGNATGIGNEGSMDFYSQRITIDNVRRLVKIKDVPMTQKRVGFDVLQKAKRGLINESAITLDEDITTALSVVSANRVQGRYLYGALDSNYNATHATGLATIDATNDQLSTSMIEKAKNKAKIPVNATARIRPMKIQNGKNYEDWYTLVAHSYAIRDLVNNDAAFRNEQLLVPARQGASSFLFTGSSFKGNWRGVLVYEYENISLETNTNSIQCAQNLFMGATAGAVAWGQRSKFGEEDEDVGHNKIYETHEIRGVAKCLFTDRTTPEDKGIIHVFSAAVADA